MTFLVWMYTSQNCVQTQQNCASSHDSTTATFRIPEYKLIKDSTSDIIICIKFCNKPTIGNADVIYNCYSDTTLYLF